ncbi:hypothetical protein SAMN05444397_105196 [Flavobacterium aquidurense]|nr:hypothetical protein SAMN05444397_105196 [Flavobacterium aquidurense]
MKKNKFIIKKDKNGCLYHYELKDTAVKIFFNFIRNKNENPDCSTFNYLSFSREQGLVYKDSY